MKVSDLTGAELDKWVAQAIGYWSDPDFDAVLNHEGYWVGEGTFIAKYRYRPSTNWSQGGALIEKYKICLCYECFQKDNDCYWVAAIEESEGTYLGSDKQPLIAAMRAIVASVYGESVDNER